MHTGDCSGYAFAASPGPAHDEDGCRAAGKGRCVVYRGSARVSGTQSGLHAQDADYKCYAATWVFSAYCSGYR